MTTTTATDLEARAAWSLIAEPADRIAVALTQTVGHATALATLLDSPDDLADLLLEREVADDLAEAMAAVSRWRPRYRRGDAERALQKAESRGITLVDPTGVPGIADLGTAAPHLLWVRGSADLHQMRKSAVLTVTGARAATSYGQHVTREIVHDLAHRGVTISAGGAYGIDASAHQAAIEAGGVTIAWLAGGVDRPYPAGHYDLFERVTRTPGCAVVSEVAPGGTPTKHRFAARARLMAATSQAVLVTEAGWRSGAIHVASTAMDLGLRVGVVPGPITSPASAGCHRLARDLGAALVTSADEAFELLEL